MSAQCYEDGRWNQTLILEDTFCEPLKCPDPGHMLNAHRVVFNEEEQDTTGNFYYRSQIQYKCDMVSWQVMISLGVTALVVISFINR